MRNNSGAIFVVVAVLALMLGGGSGTVGGLLLLGCIVWMLRGVWRLSGFYDRLLRGNRR